MVWTYNPSKYLICTKPVAHMNRVSPPLMITHKVIISILIEAQQELQLGGGSFCEFLIQY